MAKRAIPTETAKITTEPLPRRMCGAMQVHQWLLESEPDFRMNMVELERNIRNRLRTAMEECSIPYQISVVVHVVYQMASQNISKSQITSQIRVLRSKILVQHLDLARDLRLGYILRSILVYHVNHYTDLVWNRTFFHRGAQPAPYVTL